MALNLACRWLGESNPLVALCGSMLLAPELLKRWRGGISFVRTGAFDADAFTGPAVNWSWGPLAAVVEPPEDWQRGLCIEIDQSTLEVLLPKVSASAARGALLAVVCSTFLRRWLPAWQGDSLPARKPVGALQVINALRMAGWEVEIKQGFHGLRAILWGFAYRFDLLVRRPDWAGRASLAMRGAYLDSSWSWAIAPVVFIGARKA